MRGSVHACDLTSVNAQLYFVLDESVIYKLTLAKASLRLLTCSNGVLSTDLATELK